MQYVSRRFFRPLRDTVQHNSKQWCVCHAQSHKETFLFNTIEIDRNENNWQDSFQTIVVLANDSYKQKCFLFPGMHHKRK